MANLIAAEEVYENFVRLADLLDNVTVLPDGTSDMSTDVKCRGICVFIICVRLKCIIRTQIMILRQKQSVYWKVSYILMVLRYGAVNLDTTSRTYLSQIQRYIIFAANQLLVDYNVPTVLY